MSQPGATRPTRGRRGVDFRSPHWGYVYLVPRDRPFDSVSSAWKMARSDGNRYELWSWMTGYRWYVAYAGITVDIAQRLRGHSEDSAWFPLLSDRGAYFWHSINDGEPLLNTEASDIWERGFVHRYVPMFNKQMNARRNRDAPYDGEPVKRPRFHRPWHSSRVARLSYAANVLLAAYIYLLA